MTTLAPFDIFRVANIVGEGILWDWRRQLLWWTDIQGRRLYRHDWQQQMLKVLEIPERLGCFGLIAGSERLIAAFASGIALYDTEQASLEWLTLPEPLGPGLRFNDGRVDRRGRFWTGTMVEGGENTARASLYSVAGRGPVKSQLGGISISNGMCHSPDGTRLYFADSPTRTIYEYELHEPEGTLGPPRLFAQTPEGAYPDGATVDADGCIWSAHWGAGCVVRYTPDGRIDRTLRVPTCQPSCVCFAGPDLDVLCVTSAHEGLDAVVRDAEPHAGDVFLYRAGVQGLRESEYRL
jgi:L-arabinonolactonase